ncbi:MAG: DMT family transporter [Clostridia bacterium]|nr:DMT family transporter [Clostridia bacterium]
MKKDGWGYFCLLNTVVFFSTYEVINKTLVGKIDLFQVNFLRFFIGGLILLAFLAIKRDFFIEKNDLLRVTLLGIVNVAISMNLLQMSLIIAQSKASVVAVIFSSNPIFVFLFSAFIDKEKIHLYKLVGLCMGTAGIILIFMDKGDFSLVDFKSPILALLSACFYGLYTVLGRKVSVKTGSLKMNSYSFIIGSLISLPFVLLFCKVPEASFNFTDIVKVIYLSVFVTGLAYLTYFKGLSIIGASKGSLVFFIKPVLAGSIAVVFLKEKASIYLFIGTVLILLGIITIMHWGVMRGRIVKCTQGLQR